ncbi:helix-turn-helix domain-containing protein [Rhizobium sp. C1]|uniref:helix-turn-helix domain-containing protein n=1 Tax=Rhizobium sp. C1 TaxID=1349799 RepID=UPI001E4CD50F|nr:helix-turn-helix domain-containing protein [Rhizobium sp. C1]MCD2177730.1 helix-turn-helix domain-containing protein [Rhizobium sp. C1]
MSEYDEEIAEEKSFGEWARSIRESKGLDLKTVAAGAGISYVALYKIERGDIKNPREITKQKISRSLGVVVDAAVSIAAETKFTGSGIGSLVDFDPYDPETIPEAGGVYVFYDISQRPVYVGRSKRLRGRIKTHHDRFWFKEPIVVTGSFIEVKDDNLRNQIEEILIGFLKSNAVINKKLVDRDSEE